MEETIRRLLAEVCAIDAQKVRLDAPLIEYGLDSARAIDLVVSIEDAFNIRIPDAAARKMKTTADIVAFVKMQVKP